MNLLVLEVSFVYSLVRTFVVTTFVCIIVACKSSHRKIDVFFCYHTSKEVSSHLNTNGFLPNFNRYWHETNGFISRTQWYMWAFLNVLGLIVERILTARYPTTREEAEKLAKAKAARGVPVLLEDKQKRISEVFVERGSVVRVSSNVAEAEAARAQQDEGEQERISQASSHHVEDDYGQLEIVQQPLSPAPTQLPKSPPKTITPKSPTRLPQRTPMDLYEETGNTKSTIRIRTRTRGKAPPNTMSANTMYSSGGTMNYATTSGLNAGNYAQNSSFPNLNNAMMNPNMSTTGTHGSSNSTSFNTARQSVTPNSSTNQQPSIQSSINQQPSIQSSINQQPSIQSRSPQPKRSSSMIIQQRAQPSSTDGTTSGQPQMASSGSLSNLGGFFSEHIAAPLASGGYNSLIRQDLDVKTEEDIENELVEENMIEKVASADNIADMVDVISPRSGTTMRSRRSRTASKGSKLEVIDDDDNENVDVEQEEERTGFLTYEKHLSLNAEKRDRTRSMHSSKTSGAVGEEDGQNDEEPSQLGNYEQQEEAPSQLLSISDISDSALAANYDKVYFIKGCLTYFLVCAQLPVFLNIKALANKLCSFMICLWIFWI